VDPRVIVLRAGESGLPVDVGGPEPLLVRADGEVFGFHGGFVVRCEDLLEVHDRVGGTRAVRLTRPARHVRGVSDAEKPRLVAVARGGGHAVVEWGPISTGPNTWSVAQAQLVRLSDGAVLRTWDLDLSASRATFTFVDGREVLFVSAPSYMDVEMVWLDGGGAVRFDATSGFDFCHVDYAAVGDRLWTFGCVWAAPYEARVYDLSEWRSGRLRLVASYEQQLFYYDDVWGLRPRAGDELLVVRYATRLPAPDDPDVVEEVAEDPVMGAVFRRAHALQAEHGAALRIARHRLSDGAPLGDVMVGVPRTDERNAHLLGRDVALVGQAVTIVDGWTGESVAHALPAPARWSRVVQDRLYVLVGEESVGTAALPGR
jgi:hypothetical protein